MLQACSEENQPWISCVCSTPMSGQVRLHEFGKDASRDLNTISELFTCPDKAILPSTINIVSGVMTQIALK
jgi:ferritin-like protein